MSRVVSIYQAILFCSVNNATEPGQFIRLRYISQMCEVNLDACVTAIKGCKMRKCWLKPSFVYSLLVRAVKPSVLLVLS